MHVALLWFTYSLRLALRSVTAREPLYLVVNITLYAPVQDAVLNQIFLVKPKTDLGVCRNP